MFEWDEPKRQKNLANRHLDFADAGLMFDGRPVVHIPSVRNGEDRVVSVARIGSKLFTLVWMWRGKKQRIISFRRAQHGEERIYRKLYGKDA
jgi:uncharacterized DUF497 family protein